MYKKHKNFISLSALPGTIYYLSIFQRNAWEKKYDLKHREYVIRKRYAFRTTIETVRILPRASTKQYNRLAEIAYYQAGKIVVQTLLPEQPPVALITLNTFGTTLSTSVDTYIPLESTRITQNCSFLESRLISLYGGKSASLLIEYQYEKKLTTKSKKVCSRKRSCTGMGNNIFQSTIGNIEIKSATRLATIMVNYWNFYSSAASLSLSSFPVQINPYIRSEYPFIAYPFRDMQSKGCLSEGICSAKINSHIYTFLASYLRIGNHKKQSLPAYTAERKDNMSDINTTDTRGKHKKLLNLILPPASCALLLIPRGGKKDKPFIAYHAYPFRDMQYMHGMQIEDVKAPCFLDPKGLAKLWGINLPTSFSAEGKDTKQTEYLHYTVDAKKNRGKVQQPKTFFPTNAKQIYTSKICFASFPLKKKNVSANPFIAYSFRGMQEILEGRKNRKEQVTKKDGDDPETYLTKNKMLAKMVLNQLTKVWSPIGLNKSSYLEFYFRSTQFLSSKVPRNAMNGQSRDKSLFSSMRLLGEKRFSLKLKKSLDLEKVVYYTPFLCEDEWCIPRHSKVLNVITVHTPLILLSYFRRISPYPFRGKGYKKEPLLFFGNYASALPLWGIRKVCKPSYLRCFARKGNTSLLEKEKKQPFLFKESSFYSKYTRNPYEIAILNLSNGLQFDQVQKYFVKSKIAVSIQKNLLLPLRSDASTNEEFQFFPFREISFLTTFKQKYFCFALSKSKNSFKIYKRGENKIPSFTLVRTSVENIEQKSLRLHSQIDAFQLIQFYNLQRNRFYPGWFRLYLPDIEAANFLKNIANYYFSLGLQTLTRPSLNELILPTNKENPFTLVLNSEKEIFCHIDSHMNMSIGISFLRNFAKRRNQLNKSEYRSKALPVFCPAFALTSFASYPKERKYAYPLLTEGNTRGMQVKNVISIIPKGLAKQWAYPSEGAEKNKRAYPSEEAEGYATGIRFLSFGNIKNEGCSAKRVLSPMDKKGFYISIENEQFYNLKAKKISQKLIDSSQLWSINRVINIGFRQNKLKKFSLLQTPSKSFLLNILNISKNKTNSNKHETNNLLSVDIENVHAPLGVTEGDPSTKSKSFVSFRAKQDSKQSKVNAEQIKKLSSNQKQEMIEAFNIKDVAPTPKKVSTAASICLPPASYFRRISLWKQKGYAQEANQQSQSFPIHKNERKKASKGKVNENENVFQGIFLERKGDCCTSYGQETSQLDISRLILLEKQIFSINYNNSSILEKELLYHSLVNNCFAKSFHLVNQNRQLIDFFADYLLRFQILRQHQILYLFSAVLLNCQPSFNNPFLR